MIEQHSSTGGSPTLGWLLQLPGQWPMGLLDGFHWLNVLECQENCGMHVKHLWM